MENGLESLEIITDKHKNNEKIKEKLVEEWTEMQTHTENFNKLMGRL